MFSRRVTKPKKSRKLQQSVTLCIYKTSMIRAGYRVSPKLCRSRPTPCVAGSMSTCAKTPESKQQQSSPTVDSSASQRKTNRNRHRSSAEITTQGEPNHTGGTGGKKGRTGRRKGGRKGESSSSSNAPARERTNPSTRTPSSVRIYTSNFAEFLQQCNGAARYKVHKPLCDCPKVQRIRNGPTIVTTGSDSSCRQCNIEEEEGGSFIRNLNGLVVLPDIKRIPAVYMCLGTDRATFVDNPLAAETTLRDEIYHNVPSTSWKLSCASCLLTLQPNGFVCISSTSSAEVDWVRDLARTKALEKDAAARHADHAHYVCTFPLSSLRLRHTARTREQERQASDELREHMMRQGVPVEHSYPVELQHHLTALLDITGGKILERNGISTTPYWLALVYDDTNGNKTDPCWSLDLPGGKRHLGETAFQGAMRETEEESSLKISTEWLHGESTLKARKDPFNAYFLLRPPPELLD